MLSFPPGFLWGAATAAQQVEGQNTSSDWFQWEQLPGKIKHGDSSRVACDWWGGRWREDFDRAQAFGMNAQRIGIEWARIEPRPGEWDNDAIRHYREMLTGLHERGMEPFVTLHHFSSPQWVAQQGGFENSQIAQWMARWAEKAAQAFGDLTHFWVTLNEPNVYARQCYLEGLWLAQKKDILAAARVLRNEVRAHAAMYHSLKRVQPEAQVGLAYHWRMFDPLKAGSPLDRLAAKMRAQAFEEFFFTAIREGRLTFPFGLNESIPEARGTQDFVGLNYYYQEFTAFDVTHAAELFGRTVALPESERLHQFFEGAVNLVPDAFRRAILHVAQANRPIYITENGLFATDRNDQTEYLVTHLQAVHQAITAGADVRGYFWWSLLDNFEWSEGYTPRFGLYQTDFETQARTMRPVGELYAQIIRANGIPDALLPA